MSDLGIIEMGPVVSEEPKKAKPLTKEPRQVTFPELWKVYPVREGAIIPTLATEFSAAYDISACLNKGSFVTTYLSDNEVRQRQVVEDLTNNTNGVWINPGERMLIPTGLKFLIDPSFYVTIYCRSGISLKQGLTIINKVGVIDADYFGEVMITLFNESKVRVFVPHGTRLVQAILCNRVMTSMQLPISDVEPEKTTTRDGGFGSTGTNKKKGK